MIIDKSSHLYYYIFIIIVPLIVGILFYVFYNEWIIISLPKKNNLAHEIIKNTAYRKNITFWYWNKDSFKSEEKEIIVADNKARTLEYIINSWLSLLDEEHVMSKKVALESVLIDQQEQDAFISLDRNPFDKQASMYQKLMWIESLLKTIKSSGIAINTITLLIHHKLLNDHHLDFSQPWPITGFLET